MGKQMPARGLPLIAESEIPEDATCLVAVDARALRRAMISHPEFSIRALVTVAVELAYPARKAKVKRKGK